jgi:hypothetical protein
MKTPIDVTDSASRFAPTNVSQVFPLRSGKPNVALAFAGAPDIARGDANAEGARLCLRRDATFWRQFAEQKKARQRPQRWREAGNANLDSTVCDARVLRFGRDPLITATEARLSECPK